VAGAITAVFSAGALFTDGAVGGNRVVGRFVGASFAVFGNEALWADAETGSGENASRANRRQNHAA